SRAGERGRVGADEITGGRLLIGVEIVVYRGALDILGRVQQQGNTVAALVGIVEVGTTAEILVESVLTTNLPGQAHRYFVFHDWDVNRAFEITIVIITVDAFDVAAELIRGRF